MHIWTLGLGQALDCEFFRSSQAIPTMPIHWLHCHPYILNKCLVCTQDYRSKGRPYKMKKITIHPCHLERNCPLPLSGRVGGHRKARGEDGPLGCFHSLCWREGGFSWGRLHRGFSLSNLASGLQKLQWPCHWVDPWCVCGASMQVSEADAADLSCLPTYMLVPGLLPSAMTRQKVQASCGLDLPNRYPHGNVHTYMNVWRQTSVIETS